MRAGGPREEFDPVRSLANHSSGRQGWALAHAALSRGARVTLAAANVDLETPPGAERLDVGDAAELAETVAERLPEVDALIDRKSTRLNSSHVAISYAVFCLKKKKYIIKY